MTSASGIRSAPMLILPVPFGLMTTLPLAADVIALPFTSKSPPNWGVVSSTTAEMPPAAAASAPHDVVEWSYVST